MISRRKILETALAAPFIIGSMRTSASLAKQADSGSSADHTAQVLATLAPGKWSGDVVLAGHHIFNLDMNVIAPGNTCVPVTNNDNFFPFSSGVYCGGKKRYFSISDGGHADFNGGGVCYFNCTTGKWVQSETPARYSHNPSDVTEQPSCGGVSPWGTGPYNGDAWPSESTNLWYAWPNTLGHFVPIAGHTYSQVEWCPELNLIHRYAIGGFTGNAERNQGIWTCDPDTGLLNQNPKQATSGGVDFFKSTDGFNFVMPNKSGAAFWIKECQKLFVFQTGTGGAGHYDPVAKTVQMTYDWTVHNSGFGGATGFDADFVNGCCGCVIDDPINPGHRAIVALTTTDGLPYPATDILTCYPKVDSPPPSGSRYTVVPIPFGFGFGPTAPVSHDSVWFDAAKYVPGSTKIIVFDYFRSGGTLYLLDKTTWNWSGPISGATLPGTWPAGSGYRLIQVMDDYVTADYVPVMLVWPSPAGPGGSRVHYFKIPTSLL